MIEVISLSRAFSNTGKYRISAVLCCDITNQLLNQDRLTHTCSSEQTDLTALLIGAEQINDFDSGFKKLLRCGLFRKSGSRSVNRLISNIRRRWFIVDRLTQHVKDTSQRIFADRHTDGSSGCHRIHAADKSVRGSHCDTSYRIVAQVLCNFHNKLLAIRAGDPNRFIDLRKLSVGKLDIQYGADNLCDFTVACTSVFCCHILIPFIMISVPEALIKR